MPSNLTFRSAPEFATVETFAQFLIDDERTEFTHEELSGVAYRVERSISTVRVELEAYGFKLARREVPKNFRTLNSNPHDRWTAYRV